ncbi:hypothetical protein FACS1894184_04300 [Clostridia bacterium]|nr:hypothetical protein FACS1894184_04300 [Clostridia bacterium]
MLNPNGFSAAYGLTVAERHHSDFGTYIRATSLTRGVNAAASRASVSKGMNACGAARPGRSPCVWR